MWNCQVEHHWLWSVVRWETFLCFFLGQQMVNVTWLNWFFEYLYASCNNMFWYSTDFFCNEVFKIYFLLEFVVGLASLLFFSLFGLGRQFGVKLLAWVCQSKRLLPVLINKFNEMSQSNFVSVHPHLNLTNHCSLSWKFINQSFPMNKKHHEVLWALWALWRGTKAKTRRNRGH